MSDNNIKIKKEGFVNYYFGVQLYGAIPTLTQLKFFVVKLTTDGNIFTQLNGATPSLVQTKCFVVKLAANVIPKDPPIKTKAVVKINAIGTIFCIYLYIE
jgi:hypothetical protein